MINYAVVRLNYLDKSYDDFHQNFRNTANYKEGPEDYLHTSKGFHSISDTLKEIESKLNHGEIKLHGKYSGYSGNSLNDFGKILIDMVKCFKI